MLRDQAFPSAGERALVQSTPASVCDFADAQNRRAGAAKHPLEGGAPLGKRPIAQIGATLAQQVKGDVGGRMAGRILSLRQMNASLELLKPGRLALRVERNDLAVQDDRCLLAAAPALECRGDFRELIGLLVAETGPEPHAPRARERSEAPGTSAIARMPSYLGS